MRKITQEIVSAFNRGERRSMGNTTTSGDAIYLHGNKIAWKVDGRLFIDSCGWNTNTTRERLNGLPGVTVRTKLGQMSLNGKDWYGNAVDVLKHTKGV